MVYEELAASLTAEYELFLFALAGRYQQIRAPGVAVTPMVVKQLQADAYRLGKTFVDAANLRVTDYLQAFMNGGSEELTAALAQRRMVARALIRGMVAENIHQITQLVKMGGMFVDMLKTMEGGLGLLVQRQAGVIEFKNTDTAGRKWEAKKLMWVIVRDVGYQSWLDYQADANLMVGNDLMEVDGTVFSLSGAEGYPSFNDIRGKVFHPNSKKTMVPHVPS